MRKCVAEYIKLFPDYTKKIEIKESDLIYAMKEGDRRTVNILKEAKYEWDSLKLINELELCAKYNVPINCSIYEKLVKDNNISTVVFMLLNFNHEPHDIQYMIKYINSDEMSVVFLTRYGRMVSCGLFNLAYRNNFTETLKLLKSYLTTCQIIEILDMCDLNLVVKMGIESMIKHLKNNNTNYYNRIVAYGKLEQFDLLDHGCVYDAYSLILFSYLDYINFTGLRKLLKHKVYDPEFSIENTIKLVDHKYFDTTLPEKLSEFLLFDLSKIVVSYL